MTGLINMTNEQYHADLTHVSGSGLSLINESPAKYKYQYLDGNREIGTPALILGSAIHKYILEGEEAYNAEYVNAPDVSFTTKEGKAIRDQLLATGKQIVRFDDFNSIVGMAESIHRHPIAFDLLAHGVTEQSFFGEIDGAPVKCRADFITLDEYVIDLKSTVSAEIGKFGRDAYSFRYHVKAALYLDVIKAATGQEMKGFIFIAIEKKAPYDIGIYVIEPEDLELGKREYMKDLQTYKQCVKTGIWPSYNYEDGQPMIKKLKLPKWAYYD